MDQHYAISDHCSQIVVGRAKVSSSRYIVTCRLLGSPAALTIELRRGHVSVPKKFLDLSNAHVGIQQQGGGCCPERVGGIETDLLPTLTCPHRAGSFSRYVWRSKYMPVSVIHLFFKPRIPIICGDSSFSVPYHLIRANSAIP